MLGAIIGDMVGSVYEGGRIAHEGFPLFTEQSRFTDDSVLTIAIADALMRDGGTAESFVASMREFGNRYPRAGYGGKFRQWLKTDDPQPYNSWGNGSAMRVAPVGWFADSLEQAKALAGLQSGVTHNHPEAVTGAMAIAAAIYLARTGADKTEIRDYVRANFGYALKRNIIDMRHKYRVYLALTAANHTFVRAKDTVPAAIIAFLDSNSFEETIRNAVLIGGDTDTIAAMAGSIAEAYWGIPDYPIATNLDPDNRTMISETWRRLPADLQEVIERWYATIPTPGRIEGGATFMEASS